MTVYESLSDLRDAYNSGDLDAINNKLFIDNNTVYLYVRPEEGHPFEKVFEAHPSDLLAESLSLLGIPHEPA